MNDTPQRYRATLLLFAGGILVSAALVASQMPEGNIASAQGSTVQNGPAFDEWADQDPAPDEQKRKLLGQVERNGEMVEVREALPEDGMEPAEDSEADADAGAERAELAP